MVCETYKDKTHLHLTKFESAPPMLDKKKLGFLHKDGKKLFLLQSVTVLYLFLSLVWNTDDNLSGFIGLKG